MSVAENTTKLIDLNMDCLHLIGESLDLFDLLNLAQASQKLSIFAIEQFRLHFSQKKIRIRNDESKRRNRRPQPINDNGDVESQLRGLLENFELAKAQKASDNQRVFVYNDCIFIYDLNVALDVFKYFGSVIQKLNIECLIESSKWEILSHSINKYCIESLIQLDLGSVNQNSLQQFTATFKNVEEFSIEIANEQKNFRILNEMFPQLRRISLKMNWEGDYSFVDCLLPHLEHVTIAVNTNTWIDEQIDLLANEATIESMMRKNPHLRSVDLNNFSIDFVKSLEQLLPNFERLTLSSFNLNDEIIQFENVKEFQIKNCKLLSPTQLTFANLQTLRLDYNHNQFEQWLNFFRMNKNVSQLEFDIESVNLPSTQLDTLVAELPNLTEITVKNLFPLAIEVIVQLIKNNSKLRKFKYIFYETDEDALRESLEYEWKIREGGDGVLKIFTFQKRF